MKDELWNVERRLIENAEVQGGWRIKRWMSHPGSVKWNESYLLKS